MWKEEEIYKKNIIIDEITKQERKNPIQNPFNNFFFRNFCIFWLIVLILKRKEVWTLIEEKLEGKKGNIKWRIIGYWMNFVLSKFYYS